MLPRLTMLPLLVSPAVCRSSGAGVAILEDDLEDTGGLSIKEVSVVLGPCQFHIV